MLLASPALQYATSKYIFGLKVFRGTDNEAAEEFAKLLITALAPATKKKTSKRKA
jgi:hypothetical protein